MTSEVRSQRALWLPSWSLSLRKVTQVTSLRKPGSMWRRHTMQTAALGRFSRGEGQSSPFQQPILTCSHACKPPGNWFFFKQINLQVRAVQSMSECNLMRSDTWNHPRYLTTGTMRGINKLLELPKAGLLDNTSYCVSAHTHAHTNAA